MKIEWAHYAPMKTARELLTELTNAGFAQTEIVDGTGLSASTISRVLNGHTDDTSSNNLIAISAFHAKYAKRVARAKAAA